MGTKSTILLAGLSAIIIIMALSLLIDEPTGANVAIIPIHGVISTQGSAGPFSDSVATSSDIIRFIEQADESSTIEAIILEINSPGGSAVASDEIARAVEKAEKPTVAWIREAGASGGYWIASEADWIIANRMSITGSVGVVASYLEFHGFLEDNNITYQRLVAGEHKDIGSPFAELDTEQKDILQAKLDRIHGFFLDDVQQNRNLTQQQREEIDSGVFLLGIEAYELDLVDELGGRDEVKAWLIETIDDEPTYHRYEKERGLFEDLFGVQKVTIPGMTIRS